MIRKREGAATNVLVNLPSRLCQMGLSNGCVVKPMLQTHCIALTDIICLILARYDKKL